MNCSVVVSICGIPCTNVSKTPKKDLLFRPRKVHVCRTCEPAAAAASSTAVCCKRVMRMKTSSSLSVVAT